MRSRATFSVSAAALALTADLSATAYAEQYMVRFNMKAPNGTFVGVQADVKPGAGTAVAGVTGGPAAVFNQLAVSPLGNGEFWYLSAKNWPPRRKSAMI